MNATITTYTPIGISAHRLFVEVDTTRGIPSFAVIGLPDSQVQELRERVRAAITNNGYAMPRGRVVVNITPADVRKHAPGLDLPVALAVLMTSDDGDAPVSRHSKLGQFAAVGELALGGELRPVRGVLAMAEAAAAGGVRYLIVAEANANEAALVAGLTVYPARTLRDAACILNDTWETAGAWEPTPAEFNATDALIDVNPSGRPDMSEVVGLADVKRALMIAAAGRHSVLLVGPIGTGKTMLARRIPSLLPKMSAQEAIEVTRIHSLAGLLPPDTGLVTHRPFRAPHHTISAMGLLGGGRDPHPGEVSLAHNGVLMLDEILAFAPRAVEDVINAVKIGESEVVRGYTRTMFPAAPLLVGAAATCRCGQSEGTEGSRCRCTPTTMEAYRDRLGDVAARFDMVINLRRRDLKQTHDTATGEVQLSSEEYRSDVTDARRTPPTSTLTATDLGLHHYGHGDLTLLRVARTIADLAFSDELTDEHITEARRYTNPT